MKATIIDITEIFKNDESFKLRSFYLSDDWQILYYTNPLTTQYAFRRIGDEADYNMLCIESADIELEQLISGDYITLKGVIKTKNIVKPDESVALFLGRVIEPIGYTSLGFPVFTYQQYRMYTWVRHLLKQLKGYKGEVNKLTIFYIKETDVKIEDLNLDFDLEKTYWPKASIKKDGFGNMLCASCGESLEKFGVEERVYDEDSIFHKECYKEYITLREVNKLSIRLMKEIYREEDYKLDLVENLTCIDSIYCAPGIRFYTIDGDITIYTDINGYTEVVWEDNYKKFDLDKLKEVDKTRKSRENIITQDNRRVSVSNTGIAFNLIRDIRDEVNPDYRFQPII